MCCRNRWQSPDPTPEAPTTAAIDPDLVRFVPAYMHLLSMIAATGAEGACVCDLVEPSGRSQPTVSHHLKILREAGLVVSEKRGTWAWYSVQPERIAGLKAALG